MNLLAYLPLHQGGRLYLTSAADPCFSWCWQPGPEMAARFGTRGAAARALKEATRDMAPTDAAARERLLASMRVIDLDQHVTGYTAACAEQHHHAPPPVAEAAGPVDDEALPERLPTPAEEDARLDRELTEILDSPSYD